MDRVGLERLCRYVLQPPLAPPRVERFQGVNGWTMVRIEMKPTYSDGTHAIELSALGLAEKLAALIPPPRANTILCSGVLAPNAAMRRAVVPKAPTSTDAEKAAREARKLRRRDGPKPRSGRKRSHRRISSSACFAWRAENVHCARSQCRCGPW
jgi:hypothetical protein